MSALLPTYPEPRRDIEAQFAALADPDHPKRSVWVSVGTAWASGMPCLHLPAGRFYGARPLLAELEADPTRETLARLLDYIECRDAIRGDGLSVPVVQALDPAGWVVLEMLSSWEKVGLARHRAQAYGTVHIVSSAACQERRARLLAEEAAGAG